MNNTIEEKLIEITSKTLNVKKDEISVDSNFIDDLGADSLDQVELIMELEEAFSCEIPDDEAAKIRTVKDAVSYIQNKTAVA